MLLLQSETHWMGTRISYLGEGVLNSYKGSKKRSAGIGLALLFYLWEDSGRNG